MRTEGRLFVSNHLCERTTSPMNLIDQIISTIEHWQKHLLMTSKQDQSTSMSDLELSAQSLGKRIAQLALSHLLEQSGTGYDRSTRSCACGGKQRFERFSQRTLRTLMGDVTYKRAYYRCRWCGASSFPLDELIKQSQREISPAVERAVALLSAHLPFAEAERVLREVTSVSLSGRQIETVAESLGAEAELLQQQEEELAASQGLACGSGPNQPEPRTFIVEMDGVQVGLQDGRWQEAKCGVIYELDQRVEIHEGRWELLKRHRCVLRGDATAFRRRLWALCLRAGLRDQDRIVVIGDGAEWIDQTASLLFPKALRILDYYHASERIWSVAAARWGEGSAEGRRWAESKLTQLKAGDVKEVINSMKKLKMRGEEGRAITAAAIKYLRGRVEQMRYKEYREAGLPIGSGAVESSCKQVVTARCKQAGMRWSEAGVDAILALRSFVLNERLDELCPKPEISIDWAKAA
jgi:Uncharacterised protein family (UPF0236)